MNSNRSNWSALAAAIEASDRSARLIQQIERLAAVPGGAWWGEVFRSLHAQLSQEYALLKSTYRSPLIDPPQLAWRARNLLEICVWCLYCCKSKDNARRFYEDAARDVIGIVDAFEKWGKTTGQDQDWTESIRVPRQVVLQRAASVGITSVSGSYKEVRHAAKEVGMDESFRVLFRMLSKFAHPTALQILGKASAENILAQKEIFFSNGCVCFIGGFTELENRVSSASMG